MERKKYENANIILVTCVTGTGALLAANSMQHPLPLYMVGFGVWVLFFYSVAKRHRER